MSKVNEEKGDWTSREKKNPQLEISIPLLNNYRVGWKIQRHTIFEQHYQSTWS